MNRRLGRFDILGALGRGSMGEVLKAHDPLRGAPVALKVMDADLLGDIALWDQFWLEARLASRLLHPNIIALLEVGEGDGRPYLVLEYVEGRPLSEFVRPSGLPLARALSCACQLASALEHAHAAGILHRDIKSDNLLLTPASALKVCDFGIARALGPRPLTGGEKVSGTVRYLPPEAILEGRFDQRGDIYSCGIVLYEMLTGRVPFEGDSDAAVVYAQLQTDPPPPSALREGIDPSLDYIVLRAIARDPAGRYQRARDLREALERHGERIGAPAGLPGAALAREPKHGRA